MKITIALVVGLFFISCKKTEPSLPVFGNYEVEIRDENGIQVYDTTYHSIQSFSFVDQDSSIITNETFDGKIYVADFFFTSCPSICPIMKTQMLRVYETFIDSKDILILSHTIDPVYDSVAVLHEFADRLGVKSDRWHFVTGDKQEIFKIAQLSYMSVVAEDNEADGGYVHSGRFLLVDKERHIRGAYDGTNADDVDLLIKDIGILQKEYRESR